MRNALLLVVLFVVSSHASLRASTVDFYLVVDVSTNTWTLSASTDSPGGIAGIVVDLINVDTGTSVAPRGFSVGVGEKGFRVGNTFLDAQAFAAQYPLQLDSLVYGVGYAPVPTLDFGINGQEPMFMTG